MKFQIVVCIGIQFLYIVAATSQANSTTSRQGKRADLEYLGFVDGKNYFVYAFDQDWYAARDMCQSYGMKLASITTNAQLEFLKSRYDMIWGHEHWIGLRDAQLPRALSYDDTGLEPPTLTGIDWVFRGYTTYLTCGAYNPNSNYGAPTPVPQLVMFPCNFGRPVLCST